MKKPSVFAKILLCFLSFLVFSILGASVAGISGAGEDQGLAAGAIVLVYGLIAGFFGIVGAIVLLAHLPSNMIKKLNLILAAILAICFAFIAFRVSEMKEEEQMKNEEEILQRTTPLSMAYESISLAYYENNESDENIMGLGLFRPDFYQNSILYFYPQPEIGKALNEHQAVDSLVFGHSEMDQYEIVYAPPYLVPAHLKMDYDLILFRIKKLSSAHVEIVVNERTGQTVTVDKFKGTISFWPEFILSVTSVELMPEFPQKFRTKPLDHSSEVIVDGSYEWLKPETVQGDWLEVSFRNKDYKPEGRAWIRWKQGDRFVVKYSLLS